ncbi:MAG: DUF72 domain-containing protein [Alphaproteobacteria bacterium]|nr:DUF72 domain-containing protein [Alphaproteobacteria bacterium]
MATSKSALRPIRVGIGGWTFEPWEKSFYPPDLPKKRQLEYASSKVSAIEVNGTFYRLQKPETFQKWADETPDDFMFTLKAHNFCMSRKTPEAMGQAINNFINSGVTALGDKLGPINWQFHPSRTFDADYFEAFCSQLPKERNGVALTHAIEVRHASYNTDAFEEILRKHRCALVSADDDDWPMADRVTADFAYARLQKTEDGIDTGYAPPALDAWGKTFKAWAKSRAVFVFFIAGAKARNPAAAQALMARVG